MKDKRLSEMKNDYENIPIPEDLSSRVTASIEAAKKELADMPPKKARIFSFSKAVTRTASVAITAMLVLTIMTNSSENIAYAMSDIPFLGAIARVVTFQEYTHEQDNMEANVKVPTVSVEDTEGTPLEDSTAQLNQKIEEYTSQIIAAYEQDIAASGGQGYEDLSLDYEIITDDDKLFTLRFDESVVMAGSMHAVMIYNLDKTTGQLISLKDLFKDGSDYVTAISDNIKEQMQDQMAADENVTYFYETDMPDLDFSEISVDENFYISESGTLTLVFDKYEVAPGYMGSVEFEIPTSVISDIVKDGYLN